MPRDGEGLRLGLLGGAPPDLGPRRLVALLDLARAGIGGALISSVAYAIVIWAMSVAPMAHVVALRETSVVVAAWLGARVLREPLGARRMLAAGLVAAGVVLLYVGGAT